MSSNSLSLLAGPQLLAFMFNWGLLGLLNLQVYLYHVNFPKDRKLLRGTVYAVLVFEWVQTGLITAQVFDSYVYNFGDTGPLLSNKWIWFSSPVMCSFIAATVQLYFAWRIFTLSKPNRLSRLFISRVALYVLISTIILLSIGQATLGIVGGFMLRVVPSSEDLQDASWPLFSWLVVSAADDVLIAIVLCVLLLKSKTGIASTDALLHRIIRLTVETGAITTIFAVVDVIVANIPQTDRTLLYQFPSIVMTKLYANSFLTNLNNRAYLQTKSTIVDSSLHFSQFAVAAQSSEQETTVDVETGRSHGVVHVDVDKRTTNVKDRGMDEAIIELRPVDLFRRGQSGENGGHITP